MFTGLVEDVGTVPGTTPGIVSVLDNSIGTLSPMLIFATLLFTTRILGFARVFALDSDFKKSSRMLAGNVNRKLPVPMEVSCW